MISRPDYDAVCRKDYDAKCEEIERLRGELLLISQLQASDGSSIHRTTREQFGRAFRMAQNIASAALAPTGVKP